MRTFKLKWVAASAVVLSLLGVSLTAAPAQANVQEGYVQGAGVVTDDWGDEGEMSQNQHRYSGATGMWQWVLYADGALESNGGVFDEADIDCDFGPNTRAATINWQRRHGLSADGVVGRNTLSRADNKLRLWNDNVYYDGSRHSVFLGYRVANRYYIDVPGCTCEGATFVASYGRPPHSGGGCW